ncbi:YugN family protein [Ammoniphilus resinae]|uniref:YugN-like family protein n=1 Tax=Ammoniphilus resinae TaxID=861532 RepID=A0ABS4GMC3_9BACL|nr:YugN family protein [Ammoniphilus resinae]MBP1931257.1 hypothetical protein [Ammoniphilus resinae]
MKKIETNLVGMEFDFEDLEEILLNNGFNRGAMWDWHYAAYDFPINSSKLDYYTYLRISVNSVSGRIEESGSRVKIADVIITEAKYHSGLHLDKEVLQKDMKTALNTMDKVAKDLQVSVEFNARQAKDDEKAQYVGTRKKH